ncbi:MULTISPECIES: hypothetical protein [unclassified Pseudomonas]|uniref:hypothetical protein n=1 Tax=unclassified Pseudomonas TaxID=196821 RepID=UPI0030D8770A
MDQQPSIQELAAELERELTIRYGVMLGSRILWRELGFYSAAAFSQAIIRGKMEVPLFEVRHRRGYFALSKDVALWVAQQRYQYTTEPDPVLSQGNS